MKNMSLANIAGACKGIFYGTEEEKKREVSEITTDSRQVTAGSLFIAIKGERVDGHDFIEEVFEKGVLCIISEQRLSEAAGAYILVESSLQAVKDIAEFYRQQLDIKVIGITGSVGKTSTKEVIAAVLSEKYRVLKTLGNFNNELGLPLTIFRLREDDEVAVLEMGISDFGEMHRLSKIAKPDICVITNIGECHLECLKDRDGVLKAKSEIFDYLAKTGKVILNGDDDKLATIKEVKGIPVTHFGIETVRAVHATEIKMQGLAGISCELHAENEKVKVLIPIPGYHMVLNALAGAAVGKSLGLSMTEIKSGIEKLESLGGRFHLIETGKITIIDDCYNANPTSMKASLDVLKEATHRKIAILGDMFELGENTSYLHETVGVKAAKNKIDLLVCVGDMSKHIAQAAVKAGGCKEVVALKDLEDLRLHLPKLIRVQDTILVKASHGMHFEHVVAELEKLAL